MNALLKLYARLNLGDDLFLKMLCERYPNVKFYLLAPKHYDSLMELDNLEIFESNFRDTFIKRIKRRIQRVFFPSLYNRSLQTMFFEENRHVLHKIDSFISLGGSIFMQSNPNHLLDGEIGYYQFVNDRLRDKPKFFIGCNFGPYSTEDYRITYQSIFKQAKDVCFREQFSYNLFSKYLNHIRMAPDVVFGLETATSPLDSNTVGFSIITPRGGIDEDSYVAKYSELIIKYLENGFKVVLYSFCKEEGDEDIIGIIQNKLPKDSSVTTVFYNGNIEAFLKEYQKPKYMYCGRFHAMILSMKFGQTMMPVVYSEKMSNILDDTNFHGKVIEMSEFHLLNPDKVFEQMKNNTYDIADLDHLASDHFRILDQFLVK